MFPVAALSFVQLTAALTAFASLWLAAIAWRYRSAPEARLLIWLTLANALWSGRIALVHSTDNLALRLLVTKLAYPAILAAPVLSFLFALALTGFNKRTGITATAKRSLALWIIPIIALALALGYPQIRLQLRDFSIGPQGFIKLVPGPWYFVQTLYASLLMFASALILSWYAFSVPRAYRRSALLLAAAFVFPLLPIYIYVSRLPSSFPVDFTYLSILASTAVFLNAVRSGHLLDVRPIPLDLLIEQMADSLLVIAHDLRIVDCNRAALHDLGAPPSPLGRPLPQVLEELLGPPPTSPASQAKEAKEQAPPHSLHDGGSPEGWSLSLLMDALRDPNGSSGDLVVTRRTLRHFHWRLSPIIAAGATQAAGWVLAWRDVTQDRLRLAMLYEQERALALAVERRRQEHELAERTGAVLAYAHSLAQAALDSIEGGRQASAVASLAHLVSIASQVQSSAAWPLPNQASERQLSFVDELQAFLQDYGSATGCTVRFDCDDTQIPEMLSPWALLHLVRILQEILAGIRQTIDAAALRVTLRADHEWVTLGIEASPMIEAPAIGAPRAEHPADADADSSLQRWLEQSSTPQRVAALHGLLTFAGAGDASHDAARRQVTLRLPRTSSQRLAQLRDLRIVLAAAQPALRKAVTELLAQHGVVLAGVAANTEEMIALSREMGPQLILVDLAVVRQHIAAALHRLRRSAANARIIVLLTSADGEPEPGSAIRNGADGCLPADLAPEHFAAALANLLNDDPPLPQQVASDLLAAHALEATGAARPAAIDRLQLGITDRQQEILTLLVRGHTHREIATQLYISERTVRYDIQEMRRQVQAPDRAALVQFAVKHNLVKLSQPEHAP